MPHSPLTEPSGFTDLTKEEQVRYLQDLWDRIADRPGDLPAPESHLQLVEERLANYRRNPGRAKPAIEDLDELESRAKRR